MSERGLLLVDEVLFDLFELVGTTWKMRLKTISFRTQKIAKLTKFAAMTISRPMSVWFQWCGS